MTHEEMLEEAERREAANKALNDLYKNNSNGMKRLAQIEQSEFTPEQYKLIFTAVRRYQIEKTLTNSNEYQECSTILDKLFPLTYTQQQEQPT